MRLETRSRPPDTFRPLGDRVLVLPLEDEHLMSPGGLHIPEMAREKPQRGKVIAVGPGRVTEQALTITPCVAVGDIVIYGKYSGSALALEGETYIVMREADIMGVMDA